VVVADSRSPRDGKFIEILGHYDPLLEQDRFKINEVKAREWLLKGAVPTRTVKSMIDKVLI
jgi:small subunit ribosomal protein S16